MSSIRDLKITPQQIAEKGVIASPDTLTGTPDENKSVFDRLASEIIVPAVNGAIEMLGDVEDDTLEWASDEAQRQANESARQSAEDARVQAEKGRVSAETGRVSAESSRASAESARGTAEDARVQAEKGRASAESGRVTAENGRASAESARATAEQQRAKAEDAREDAEDARELAEQQRADETAGIVAQATAQAGEAADSATLSQSWARGGTGTRSGEDTNNAKYFSEQAQASAAGASTSAGAAAGSASTAQSAASQAQTARGQAQTARDAAQTAASQAQGAKTDAEDAAQRAEQAAEDAEAIAGGDFIPNSQKGTAGGVATLDSSGKVPSTQLPEMNYIPTSQKGQPGGVATLGSDGKVPEGQLPEMSGVMYVNITESGGTYSADKTFAEIESAVENGYSVVANVISLGSSTILPLSQITSGYLAIFSLYLDGGYYFVTISTSELGDSVSYMETPVPASTISFSPTDTLTSDNVQDAIEEVDGKVITTGATTVQTSAWSADTTYDGYGYRASIAMSNVTSNYVPSVTFGITEAESGNFAPVADTYSGGVYIYAKEQPTEAVNVLSISCVRGG